MANCAIKNDFYVTARSCDDTSWKHYNKPSRFRIDLPKHCRLLGDWEVCLTYIQFRNNLATIDPWITDVPAFTCRIWYLRKHEEVNSIPFTNDELMEAKIYRLLPTSLQQNQDKNIVDFRRRVSAKYALSEGYMYNFIRRLKPSNIQTPPQLACDLRYADIHIPAGKWTTAVKFGEYLANVIQTLVRKSYFDASVSFVRNKFTNEATYVTNLANIVLTTTQHDVMCKLGCKLSEATQITSELDCITCRNESSVSVAVPDNLFPNAHPSITEQIPQSVLFDADTKGYVFGRLHKNNKDLEYLRCRSIFLHLDVCEEEIVGDRYGKLLQIVPVPDALYDLHTKTYNREHYVRIKQTRAREIEISLRTHEGKEVTFGNSNEIVSIQLHFRRRLKHIYKEVALIEKQSYANDEYGT